MFKFYKFFEHFKLFRKPFTGGEKRLSISPIFQKLFQDKKEKQNRSILLENDAQHQKYIKELSMQTNHKRTYWNYFTNRNGHGLTEILQSHRQMQMNKIIYYLGDYNVKNPSNFIHRIQLGRDGANIHFWSIDDEETTKSYISDQKDDYQMYDSIIIN